MYPTHIYCTSTYISNTYILHLNIYTQHIYHVIQHIYSTHIHCTSTCISNTYILQLNIYTQHIYHVIQHIHSTHKLCSADYERVLFPIIARMELDTKERWKFFCCVREHACGCGSGPRRGHSALRPCTPHSSRADLPRKRRIVCDTSLTEAERNDAADSLKRWGIHPTRTCTALTGILHAVIAWPYRIYYGLFTYDVMHCVYLNCIGYLLETMVDLMTPTQLMELDSRGKTLPPFRRRDGTTCRRARKLSSPAYLTAEMKVQHICYVIK